MSAATQLSGRSDGQHWSSRDAHRTCERVRRDVSIVRASASRSGKQSGSDHRLSRVLDGVQRDAAPTETREFTNERRQSRRQSNRTQRRGASYSDCRWATKRGLERTARQALDGGGAAVCGAAERRCSATVCRLQWLRASLSIRVAKGRRQSALGRF